MRNKIYKKTDGYLLIGITGRSRFLGRWESFLYWLGWNESDDYETNEPTVDVLKVLTDGLNFRSESDGVWSVFAPASRRVGQITCLLMKLLTGRNECTMDNPRDFDQFMQHAIDVQDDAERYKDLYAAMSKLLTGQRVFRMSGDNGYNIGYFVVGIDALNNLVGIQVGATET